MDTSTVLCQPIRTGRWEWPGKKAAVGTVGVHDGFLSGTILQPPSHTLSCVLNSQCMTPRDWTSTQETWQTTISSLTSSPGVSSWGEKEASEGERHIVYTYPIRVYPCECSIHSRNLRNLKIALRIFRIPNYITCQSQDCMSAIHYHKGLME